MHAYVQTRVFRPSRISVSGKPFLDGKAVAATTQNGKSTVGPTDGDRLGHRPLPAHRAAETQSPKDWHRPAMPRHPNATDVCFESPHALSISGYHMAVVAGIVFFFIRAILSDRDSSLGRRVALWGVREVCGLLLASLVAGFATSRSTNAPENPPRVKRRRDRRLSRRTTNTCGTTQPACPGYAHGWAAGYGPRRRCWQVQARSKRRGGETALALLPRRR